MRLFRAFLSETGAELVEFALAAPVLLLITMGIIDFGLLFQRYEVLTNASREGARIAVLPGYEDPNLIRDRVNQYLLATSLSAANVNTNVGNPVPLTIGPGRCISVVPVTVSYTHQYMFVGGLMRFFGSSLGSTTLSATTSMRSETAAVSCE